MMINSLKMKCVFLIFAVIFCVSSLSFASQNKIIYYQDIGQGKPLVLIHAFPSDSRLWDPQQAQLKNYFRIITLDLWGFGKSSSVDGQAVTMTDFADEIKILLDQLQIQKAIIGGESMGGYVALALLDKYPNQVAGLVLSNTQSIADSEETQAKREATAIDVLQNGTTNFINQFIPKALSTNASEEIKLFLRNILDKQQATALASASRGMALRSDMSDLLANTALPILIISGDKDALIPPEQSKYMHLLAKNSQLLILANAGHLSNLEQSAQWNQAVIDMFS